MKPKTLNPDPSALSPLPSLTDSTHLLVMSSALRGAALAFGAAAAGAALAAAGAGAAAAAGCGLTIGSGGLWRNSRSKKFVCRAEAGIQKVGQRLSCCCACPQATSICCSCQADSKTCIRPSLTAHTNPNPKPRTPPGKTGRLSNTHTPTSPPVVSHQRAVAAWTKGVATRPLAANILPAQVATTQRRQQRKLVSLRARLACVCGGGGERGRGGGEGAGIEQESEVQEEQLSGGGCRGLPCHSKQ